MKARTMKRVLAGILAAVTVFSVTACGNSDNEPDNTKENGQESEEPSTSDSYYNETGYPICDEPITITVSGVQGSSPDWNNTLLVKVVEEKLGIKLECAPISSDAWANQYALMLSTGEMPDLVIYGCMDKAQVNADGEDGYWLDLNEYMDLMPNLQAFMEEYPSFATNQKTADGKIYSLGRIAPSRVNNIYSQIYYDKTLTDAAGVGEIKTVDDFYEALKLVKEAYPDKKPLACTFDAEPAYKIDHILRAAFGVESGDNTGLLVADENGKVSYADISDNYREYLKYMNKLAEEGLLDTEAFMVTTDEYYANIEAGKYVFYSAASMEMTAEDNAAVAAGDYSVQEKYEMIYGLTSDYQEEVTYLVNNGVLSMALIFVNAETEYPEAICRLIDFFASEEGQLLSVYGVENESFEYVDDGYGNQVIDQEKFWDSENYESIGTWANQEIVINQGFTLSWGFGNMYLENAPEDVLREIASDPSAGDYFSARELVEFEEDVERELETMLPLVLTSEENDKVATIQTDIINYLKTMKASFIMGEKDPYDDAVWEEYVNQVYAMGYEQLMDVQQAAYDRMMAAAQN